MERDSLERSLLSMVSRTAGVGPAKLRSIQGPHPSREIAERWAHALNQKIQTLTTFPERCLVAAEVDGFDEEVRQLLFGEGRGQYRVLFSIRGSVIRIHSIRRSARGHR